MTGDLPAEGTGTMTHHARLVQWQCAGCDLVRTTYPEGYPRNWSHKGGRDLCPICRRREGLTGPVGLVKRKRDVTLSQRNG
jgi:hypothetical protein